mmetsp:Transcript_26431/g.81667  ORF Transcript_26431/g.81667 Transcript_26431/m.81667 type:complete len:233 (+) Transcript_26431:813-1511(+)
MDRTAISRSASSCTKSALFPPSSRIALPKRAATFWFTLLPAAQLPVNEISGRFFESTMLEPTSRPPTASVAMAGLTPFRSRTRVTIFWVAMADRGVVSAGFQICVLPATMEMAEFHPKTAIGKLNAAMMPMAPSGCHCSIMKWPGRSEGSTCPGIWRERPVAKSQMSTYSCTSPTPSGLTLPTSVASSWPRGSRYVRSSSPIWRTISPRLGAGVIIQSFLACIMLPIERSAS